MGSPEEKNIDYETGTVSAVDLHDSVRRENALAPAGEGRVGIIALVIGCVILIFGGGQMFQTFTANGTGFGSSIYLTKSYQPEPKPTLGGAEADQEEVAWIEDWMSDGKKVYNNCIACHQASGLGIPGQFPPLVGSEWVDGGTKRLGAIMLNGINGPLTVGGQTYNQLMPAWNNLSDEKVAQVITYIRRTFGSLPEGEDGVVTTEMLKAAREEYGSRTTPWTEAELLAIPADAHLSGAKVDLETGEPLSGE